MAPQKSNSKRLDKSDDLAIFSGKIPSVSQEGENKASSNERDLTFEKRSVEKKTIKRERDQSAEVPSKLPQKKRKTSKPQNGAVNIPVVEVPDNQEKSPQSPNPNELQSSNFIPQQNLNKFPKTSLAAIGNNYNKFINNYSHFMNPSNFENALLAQKMLGNNAGFINQYSDVMNGKKIFP